MKILVCGARKKVECTILSRRLCGVQTHWYGGHTIACTGTDECPACKDLQAPIWKGYFIGESRNDYEKAIILVTSGCYDAFAKYDQAEAGLLGLRTVIDRVGPRANSPMRASMFGRVTDPVEFLREDLEHIVRRIFSANAGKIQK